MYFRIKILIFFLFFISFFINKPLLSAQNKNITINNIEIQNNQRLDTETIMTYLEIEVGDKINYEILNKKLKKMYKLGLFADIKFRVKGNKLIVLVKENPMINNVSFFGNKKIKEENLREDINLKPRNVFLKKDLQTAISSIQDIYKRSGYFSAKISSSISTLSQNRIDINFKIAEADRTKI